MKFNVSESNLAILTDVSCLGDLETVEIILNNIEGTSISHFNLIYEDVKQFFLDNGKFPTKAYLAEKFPRTCVFSELEQKPTADLIQYFLIELKKENIAYRAGEALITGDLEKVDSIIAERKSAKISKVDYSLSSVSLNYAEKKIVGPGIMTGVEELDSVINGLGYGTLTTFAGGAGSGKTTLARSVAYNASYLEGKNVIFITMEISREDMKAVMLSRHSKTMGDPIPYRDIIKCTLEPSIKDEISDEERKRIDAQLKKNIKRLNNIAEDYEKNKKGNIWIVAESDFPDWSFAGFERYLQSLDDQLIEKSGHGIDMVILDYIQLVKPVGMSKTMDLKEYRNLFIQYFRSICVSFKDRQLIGIILSQVNRAGMKKQNSSAEGSAGKIVASYEELAELNSIERESSVIVVIYSNTVSRSSGVLYAQVLKNRIGAGMECMVPIVADYKHNCIGGDISVKRDIINAQVLDSLEYNDAFGKDFEVMDEDLEKDLAVVEERDPF